MFNANLYSMGTSHSGKIPSRLKRGALSFIFNSKIESKGSLGGFWMKERRRARLKSRFDVLPLAYLNFPDGVIIIENGRIKSANPAFLRIFSLEKSNCINVVLKEFIGRLSFAPTDCLQLAGEWPVAGDALEVTRHVSGAMPQYLTVRRFPIPQQGGRTGAYALTFADKTALREAQRLSEELVEKLLRADRQAALGEMAMALAHELNQPLGAIVNFAGAARRTLLGRTVRVGELEDVLLNIGAEAARAAEVIRSLRQFLRGTPQPNSDANVETAIRAVLGFAEPAMREQGIQSTVQIAPQLPPVHCDQIILQQIILNLVTNAIQAMVDGARHPRQLGISGVVERGARVRIDVWDTGVGLPAALGERIFEPFITTKQNGSGLGLSIAPTLVQRLGGSIEAAEEPVRGTRFTIRVPCRQSEDLRHA